MAERKFAITIAAVDAFSGVFQKAIASVLGLKKPIEDTRKGLKNLEAEAAINSISKQMTELGVVTKDAVAAFGALVPAVSTLAGAGSLAAIATITAHVIDQNAAMSRQAKLIGINASVMQLYMGASLQVGIAADVAEQSLDGLAKTFQDAAFRRNPEALGAMSSLGIVVHKGTDGLVDFDDAWKQLQRTFDETRKREGIQAAKNLVEGFGLGPLVPLLERGESGVQKLIEQWRKFHGVISDDDLSRYERLAEKLRLIQGAAEGAGNALLGKVAPGIETVTDKILELIDISDRPAKEGGGIVGAAGEVVGMGQRGLRGTGLVMGTDPNNPELQFDLTPAVDAWKWVWSHLLGGTASGPSPAAQRSMLLNAPSGATPTGLDDEITGPTNRLRGNVTVDIRLSGAPPGTVVNTQQSGGVNATTNVEGFMPSHGP